jgi:hypothetical protein
MEKSSIAGVVDFGLNHFDFGTATTFQGGARVNFTTSNPKVRPFAQGLIGLAHVGFNDCPEVEGCSENDLTLTPAFGIDYGINDKVNVRGQLDFVLLLTSGEAGHYTRFWFGISYKLGT